MTDGRRTPELSIEERRKSAKPDLRQPAITLSVPGAEGASPINSGDSTPKLDATHRR
jgi:hypothetical protein